MTDIRQISDSYFTAWRNRDFAAVRSVLADDVAFDGPLATLDNAEDCVALLIGISEILSGIEIEKVFVDGDDVLTWLTLHTTVAPPTPAINWQRIVDGRIRTIRVVFDPRMIVTAR